MGKFKKNMDTDEAMALWLTDETFKDYYNRLETIALSIFEWVNLPDTCNGDYIEWCLFHYGKACLLYNNGTGFINTSCVDNGKINLYNLATRYNCIQADGKNYYRDLYIPNSNKNDDEECILIKNNINQYPTSTPLRLYANRLSTAERTIDLNIHALRNPFIIFCDKKQELTAKNIFAQIDSYVPKILVNKDATENDIEKLITVLKTGVEFQADKLEGYKRNVWNEALTYLGVNNISNEKSERLITSETEENNELINLNLQYFLAPRLQACNEFNARFGENITVKIRSDLENIIKRTMNGLKNNTSEVQIEKNE